MIPLMLRPRKAFHARTRQLAQVALNTIANVVNDAGATSIGKEMEIPKAFKSICGYFFRGVKEGYNTISV